MTYSSPWGTFGSGYTYQNIYFGDDAGKLHCVNGTTGASCSGSFPAQLESSNAAALGQPVVLAGTPSSASPDTIFLGDNIGRFIRVSSDGTTPTVTGSYSTCGGSFSTCNGTYGIVQSATADFNQNLMFVAGGGAVYEFPLATSGNWQPNVSAKSLASASGASSNTGAILSYPMMDPTNDWLYITWNNRVFKLLYPFDSLGGTSGIYSTTVTNQSSSQSNPTSMPFLFQGNVYVGTAPTSTTGYLERYECTASSDTAALAYAGANSTSSTASYGAPTGMITDWSNGNVYFGMAGGTVSGIVQYPQGNGGFSCPSGQTLASGACHAGTGYSCQATGGGTCPGSSSGCSSLAHTQSPYATCNGTACGEPLTCATGWGDCNSNPADGCETNIAGTDVNNCGSCGHVCNAANENNTCVAGSCSGTCVTGYAFCGGTTCTANGQCGNCCGATCGTGQACVSGAPGTTATCQASSGTTEWIDPSQGNTATITCPSDGSMITNIGYVSWGTAVSNHNGTFTTGLCDDLGGGLEGSIASNGNAEYTIVKDSLRGRIDLHAHGVGVGGAGSPGTFTFSNGTFSSTDTPGALGDPCPWVQKNLAVAVTCSCATSANCGDSTKDGTETDTDCGGSFCDGCAIGLGCAQNSDCESGYCNTSTLKCAAPACSDGVQNGVEVGVDCGGPNGTHGTTLNDGCNRCVNHVGCVSNYDCASLNCVNSICTHPSTCSAGGTYPACNNGSVCGASTDCSSGICNIGTTQGTCSSSSCSPTCAVGQPCSSNGDCSSGLCVSNVCATGYTAYADPTSGTIAGNQAYTGSLGMTFTVNKSITVTALGAFDSNHDGLASTISVAIYSTTSSCTAAGTGSPAGTLVSGLGPVTLSGTTQPLVNGDRVYTLATPVDLPPGNYTIVAWGYSASEMNGNQYGATPYPTLSTENGDSSCITFNGYGVYGGAGAYPSSCDSGPTNRYNAGTFQYVETTCTTGGTGAGSTAPCNPGSSCTNNGDCASNFCSGGVCAGINGETCTSNTQCESDNCSLGLCVSPTTCSPGATPPSTPPCANGNYCGANSDCETNHCNNGLCATPTACSVGGGTPPCHGESGCGANSDCLSNQCVSGACVGEDGDSCTSNAGCVTGNCTGGVCQTPSCAPSCAGGTACGGTSECASNHCLFTKCDYIAYADQSQNGNQNYTGTLGMDFTVGSSPITVYAVGAFDDLAHTGQGSITVGIFNTTTQTLVAGTQKTVTAATGTKIGSDYFVQLASPVTLSASTTYTVVALGYGSSYLNGNNGYSTTGFGFTVSTESRGAGNSQISFVGNGRYGSTTFGWPTSNDSGPANRYGAGTFLFY